jgi:signal transduction histidine kinase
MVMNIRAQDLLEAAATVRQNCVALSAMFDPLNDRQQNALAEMIQAADLFSNRVTDLTDLIENHLDQLSTVSHRLRTPLVTIRGYPEMLLTGSYGALDAVQERQVKQLEAEANRLAGLVQTLFNNAP